MRLTKVTVLAAVAALAASVAMAVPAQAATEENGVVEAGEFGLYYVPGSGTNYFNKYSGWVFDSSSYIFDLGILDVYGLPYRFPGTWTNVNNNTASYRNRSTHSWWVATGVKGTGYVGCLPAGYVGDASYTYRNAITSLGPRSSASC